MNISRHTSLTRIVPILITVLLALCFLPLAEKSGLFRLSKSKAYQTGYIDTSSFRLIDSQWEYDSSTTLYKAIPLVGDGNGSYSCYQVCFSGEYAQSEPLEYCFDIYDDTGYIRLYSSVYYDSGSLVNVGLPLVHSTDGIVYRCYLYVRLKNGGNINRTDMYASAWTWYLTRTTEVEEQTLPSDWFESTTQTVPNPLETYTTVISPSDNPDYAALYEQLEMPNAVEVAVTYLFDLINNIMSLHYMTFIVCYSIIMGLVAWFLH